MPEKFSASQAKKFMNCHAAANLDIAIPNWEPPIEDPDADTAANRGTRMHELFAGIMSLSISDTERMVQALDYVNGVRARRRFKSLIEVPQRADWLASEPWTTADLVLYLQDEIHVLDLKTGRIFVDVKDNEQMLFYAATYLKFAPRAKEVHMHIVQPWADNIAEEVVSVDDLAAWMNEAATHDLDILDGDTTFMPGDHCLFCPANPHARTAKGSPLCPAMMQVLYPSPEADIDAVMRIAEGEEG